MLEPDSLYYNKGESRFALGSLYTKETDPLTKFRRNYPWTCLTSERIHQKLLLVAEKEDANSEKGMAICIAKWDGDLSNFAYDPKTNKLVEGDMDQLMAIQPEIEFVEHVRAHHALERLDNLAEDLEDGISIPSSQFCCKFPMHALAKISDPTKNYQTGAIQSRLNRKPNPVFLSSPTARIV